MKIEGEFGGCSRPGDNARKQVNCSIPGSIRKRSSLRRRRMGRLSRWSLFGVIVFGVSIASAQARPDAEQRAGRYLESVRTQPSLVLAFLHEMPKGGDLHNHLGGALYAENLIDYAVDDGLCVDRTTSILIAPPCDASCEKYI